VNHGPLAHTRKLSGQALSDAEQKIGIDALYACLKSRKVIPPNTQWLAKLLLAHPTRSSLDANPTPDPHVNGRRSRVGIHCGFTSPPAGAMTRLDIVILPKVAQYDLSTLDRNASLYVGPRRRTLG
jgi:hypothetical protein